MPVLIRDAAAKYHPIIGIAALTSPVVQLNVRDNWIGWSPDAFVAQLRNNPSSQMAKWLQNIVDEAIGEVYKTDFLESGAIKPGDIKKPKANVIETFEKLTKEEREKHHRFTKASEYKSAWVQASGKVDWPTHARSPLYKSKRADFLARFLKYRMLLNEYFGDKPTGSKLERLLKKTAGTELVRGALRKVKGDKIGISVADIAVCGALPPYNELLGGKLVAMLLASPEVVNAYKKRYEQSPSIIASSMAGRPIVRAPSLALLCTTSLFAVAASQYNRRKIPCEVAGGKPGESIEYFKIGKSAGFGTHQFSPSTLEMLTNVVTQSTNGLRVNNVFGEGVNPKLRLLRQGLDELGLSSEAFLVHGSPRIVYGISLASNFKRYLLGLQKKPKYYLSMRNPKESSKKIIEWWYERWLGRRILNPDVMTRLTEHNFVHPIKHGARVPRLEDFTQPSLFDDV
jgi:hypothetical protein